MTSLLIKIHHIHECLKIICDVEAKILNSSIFGLFKDKNYAGNEHSLEVVCNKLLELHAGIGVHSGVSIGVDRVINDAKDFIRALTASTVQLLAINRALGLKANGGSYSMSTYNSDLNNFKYLQVKI